MADSLAYVGFMTDKDLHRMLISLATRRGKTPDVMAQELFAKALSDEINYINSEEEDTPPAYRLFCRYSAIRAREEQRRQLVTIALSVQETSDTGMAEQLQELCELNGFMVEDIMTQAAHLMNMASDTSVVFEETDSITKAMMFLTDIFHRKNTNALPQAVIESEAKIKGISLSSLKLAKKGLSIRSRRASKGWLWEVQTIEAPSPVRVRV